MVIRLNTKLEYYGNGVRHENSPTGLTHPYNRSNKRYAYSLFYTIKWSDNELGERPEENV